MNVFLFRGSSHIKGLVLFDLFQFPDILQTKPIIYRFSVVVFSKGVRDELFISWSIEMIYYKMDCSGKQIIRASRQDVVQTYYSPNNKCNLLELELLFILDLILMSFLDSTFDWKNLLKACSGFLNYFTNI